MVKYIKDKYGIRVDDFLPLYVEGKSRAYIARKLGVTQSAIRMVASLLGLRLKLKYRNTDYSRYISASDVGSNALEVALKELKIRNKQLQTCRDKTNLLRRELRLGYRVENIYEAISRELSKLKLPDAKKCSINIVENINNDKGKTIICLSDLHIGSLVDKNDVLKNEYTFEIMKSRIEKIFREALIDSNISSSIDIVLLGDIFDGVIHNSHLVAEMPVVKAITDFSYFIANIINSISSIYDIRVQVVTGNHDRITDDQQIYKKGFDFTYLFVELLRNMVRNVEIKYHITGFGVFDVVKDKKAYMFHGDIDRTYKVHSDSSINKALKDCAYLFKTEPILILSGHTHQYGKRLLPNNGVAINVGSLVGTNNYSFNKVSVNSNTSQCILFYNSDGDLISEKIITFSMEENNV